MRERCHECLRELVLDGAFWPLHYVKFPNENASDYQREVRRRCPTSGQPVGDPMPAVEQR